MPRAPGRDAPLSADKDLAPARRTALTAPAGNESLEEPGPPSPLPERFEDLRLLGSGAFGEVRRVLDKKLGRAVAMKILRADADTSGVRERFLAEIKLTANLQHPGIVAIHDFGELSDGRLWYTMLEVRGRTLRAILDEAFDPLGDAGSRWGRRRLLDVFARASETVGYAHSRGVIHRDLKPENMMIGEFGQVMVMDWGLARQFRDEPDVPMVTQSPATPAPAEPSLTRHGDILGTPAYMSPEQALGEVHRHGPAADVYSLGAILFHMLAGRPPFADLGPLAWKRIQSGDPPKLSEVAAANVPRELISICERAMSREPADRFPDASALAEEVTAFLDGARRRERALLELKRPSASKPQIIELRKRAEALRAQAKEVLARVKHSDPVEIKLPGWELEDEAERHEREANLLEATWLQGIHGALAIDPDLAEAHALLADHYKQKLIEAERGRREGDAAQLEVLLRAHDRGKHAAILSGKGALTLVTDPEGARVFLYRYTPYQRRLVPKLMGELGRTPLCEVPLEKGSYLLRIQSPGRIDVSYPVLIERGECWHGCAPCTREPRAIVLPSPSEIDAGEVYVPAGYCWTGGDPDAPDGLPRRFLWIEGFLVGKHPVTNEEYLAFLNDMVAAGREDEALAACPRSDRGVSGGTGEQLAYARGRGGEFQLKERESGLLWRPRSPVVLMTWRGALAFARWRSARTQKAVCLLHELWREKAARGVDGRYFPWGNAFDPNWTRMLTSQSGEPSLVEVDAYPHDESPYGMRGGAGNVRDVCGNRWALDGPALQDAQLAPETGPEDGEYISCRGGSWHSVENLCRAAARFVIMPDQWRTTLGMRVARAFP